MAEVEKITPYGSDAAKGHEVEAMFDNIAPAYDFMNTAMSFGLHVNWRNRALKQLAAVKHDDILDVATGTGDVALAMYERFKPHSITGLDLSEGMLRIAREKLGKASAEAQKAITFVKGDSLAMPFDDESFDLVTVAYGVRNFENLAAGLREMHRVIRPGGTLCIIELSCPTSPIIRPFYDFYSRRLIPAVGRLVSGDSSAYTYLPESIAKCPQREEMTGLMRDCGFTNCRYRSLTFGVVTLYYGTR